jgi:hypothetical protein
MPVGLLIAERPRRFMKQARECDEKDFWLAVCNTCDRGAILRIAEAERKGLLPKGK